MDTNQNTVHDSDDLEHLPVPTEAERSQPTGTLVEPSASSPLTAPPPPLATTPWQPAPEPPATMGAPNMANPYAPPEPAAPAIHTGDSAGATTVQQVTVQMPSMAARTNTLAILSIVAALLWVGWLGSFAAVVAGLIARKQIRDNGNVERGDGLALVGIILGGLSFVPLLFFIGIGILGALGAAAG
ncbi:MAG: DUF4190 domain-containing protein [Ornithinimicrobium sp.]